MSLWSGRLRRRKARLGLHAPVAVRPQVAWHWRALQLLGVVVVGTLVTVLAYQWFFERSSANAVELTQEIGVLRAKLDDQNKRLEELQAIANSADAQLKVERTAVAGLSEEVRRLETDNARLKTDLGYFERLLPSSQGQADGDLSLRGLEASREMRANVEHVVYRALVSQMGRQPGEFAGHLQLQLIGTQDGKPSSMVWPAAGDNEAAARARLTVKRHQRVEGAIAVPKGWQVRSVQLKVLEKNQVRASQSVSL